MAPAPWSSPTPPPLLPAPSRARLAPPSPRALPPPPSEPALPPTPSLLRSRLVAAASARCGPSERRSTRASRLGRLGRLHPEPEGWECEGGHHPFVTLQVCNASSGRDLGPAIERGAPYLARPALCCSTPPREGVKGVTMYLARPASCCSTPPRASAARSPSSSRGRAQSPPAWIACVSSISGGSAQRGQHRVAQRGSAQSSKEVSAQGSTEGAAQSSTEQHTARGDDENRHCQRELPVCGKQTG